MKRLTKGQIEGIRMVADYLVIGDITDKVMTPMMPEQELAAFREHMKKSCPLPFAAGSELNRQIKEVRAVWLHEIAQRGRPA